MGLTLAEIKEGLAMALMASGPVGVVLVALLSRTFASKADLAAQGERLAKLEERLSKGDARFAALEGAIGQATEAARAAKHAAEEIVQAAEKIHGTEVAVARMDERIQAMGDAVNNLEHFVRLMVEGHMKLGA